MVEIRCIGCHKRPEDIPEYVTQAREEGVTPSHWCAMNEGTFNPTNGRFACTACYIDMGMPSSGDGWKAP